MSEASQYEFNEDGSAKDPKAFRDALRADPLKLDVIASDTEIASIVLGDDDEALQSLLKSLFQASDCVSQDVLRLQGA